MRRAIALLLLLVAACAEGPPAVFVAAPPPPPRVRAVLVGAESSIPAFDNATDRFAKDLATRTAADPALIVRFSNRPLPDTERSALPLILHAIGTMQAGSADSCLIYVTGHGIHGQGVALPRSRAALDPNALDQAIASGCGSRPTVVVISACFSGLYAASNVARDNRIVLTAARADRPSFGCGVENRFTYFDGCFLSAFEDRAATTWEDVARSAIACVGARERAEDFRPSEPQLFVGKAVAGLKLPGM